MAWLSDWAKRIQITLDHNDVDAAVSGFPHLVYLSTSSGYSGKDVSCVFDELQNDGNRRKIAATRADGVTQCYVEIERWDHASEKAWLWVRVPSVDPAVDTVIWLYYDRTKADNTTYVGDTTSTPGQAVWDADFVLVCHMRDLPDNANVRDSTSYGNHGVKKAAGNPAEVDAAIDKGQDFEVTTLQSYITHGAPASLKVTGKLTLEAWYEPETLALYAGVIGRWDTGANDRCYIFMMYSASMYFYADDRGDWAAGHRIGKRAPISVVEGLVYWAGVIRADGEFPDLFKNGVDGGTDMYKDPTSINAGAVTFEAGCQKNSGTRFRFLDGKVDEVRVSKTDRSAAWVKATYESGHDHLNDFGLEETYTPPLPVSAGLFPIRWVPLPRRIPFMERFILYGIIRRHFIDDFRLAGAIIKPFVDIAVFSATAVKKIREACLLAGYVLTDDIPPEAYERLFEEIEE